MKPSKVTGRQLAIRAVIFAVFALLVAAIATAPAAGQPGASAAKKKHHKRCKHKKHGKKKKRRCKKSTMGTGSSPLVRATLTWSDPMSAADADLDLFVFDASGNRAGNGSDTIPFSTHSSLSMGDQVGMSGTETFTDLQSSSHRSFSFGVCYKVGGSVHTKFNITYITADGMTHTDSQNPGSSFHYEYPGGAPIPSAYCPTT